MGDTEEFFDATDKLMTEEQETAVALIRSGVVPHINKLEVEEAGDMLYTQLNKYQQDKDELMEHLMHTDAAHTFFHENPGPRNMQQNPEKSVKFVECIKKLTSYAVMLMKPERLRPDMWDRISVNSHMFEETLAIFNGVSHILAELGFSKMGANYVYKSRVPKVPLEKIKHVCFDLLCLTAYMEVKIGVEKSTVEVVAVPERSQIFHQADPVKQGTEQKCDMCSKPASYFCETESSAICIGKAWCKPCNDKWHTNNHERKDHRIVPLKVPPPIPDRLPKPEFLSSDSPSSTPEYQPHKPSFERESPMVSTPSNQQTPPLHSNQQTPPLHSNQREPPLHSNQREPSSCSNQREPHLHSNQPLPHLHSNQRKPPLHSNQQEPSSHSNQWEPRLHSNQHGQRASSTFPPSRAVNVSPDTKPVPKPRRSNNRVSSLGQQSPSVDLHLRAASTRDTMEEVELIINQVIASNNPALIKKHNGMLTKSLKDIHIRIENETSSEQKSYYVQEKLKLNRLKVRLEDKLDMLELEVNYSPTDGQEKSEVFSDVDQQTPKPLADSGLEDAHYEVRDTELQVTASTLLTADEQSPLSYLKCFAEAEMEGYTIDEILLGILCVPFRDLNNWLKNTYSTMLDGVIQTVDTTQQGLKLSPREIRDAFVSHGLQHPEDILGLQYQPIISLCVERRKQVVDHYLNLFNEPVEENSDTTFFKTVNVITPEMVHNAIFEANGDGEEILWLLNDKVGDKIKEFIWRPLNPDEMESIGIEGHTEELVMKYALEVLENPRIDEGIKVMVAYAELGLSHLQTDELLWSMRNLLGQDDRQFDIRDAIIAVKCVNENDIHEKTIQYLSCKCALCLDRFPNHKMANLFCHDTTVEENCCRDCAIDHFTHEIENKIATGIQCPVCGAPNLAEESEGGTEAVDATKFFEGLLTVVFPNIGMSDQLINKFNKKINVWKISADPNFFWCQNPNCSDDGFGFIDEGVLPHITCPECATSTCRKCRENWVVEHEQRTCEEFATWLRENTQEYKDGEALRDQMVEDNGIQCPKCNSRFYLARGGCMDCKCLHCAHQFCSGCGTPFFKVCPQNELLKCNRQGFHGHHPRNCHQYLRDMFTEGIHGLLRREGVDFESAKREVNCTQVVETDEQVVQQCGKEEEAYGLCHRHYKEYLSAMINLNKLEVMPLMSNNELIMELKRNGKEVPAEEGVAEDEYRDVLIQQIQDKIPFKDLSAFKNF